MASSVLTKSRDWLQSDLFRFGIKVIGIYILWYLVYELWLLPDGSLDEWVALNIVDTSAGILKALNYDIYTAGRLIGLEEGAGILLVDGCNGIAAIGLFIGFVVAYPGEWIPRISFIFIGIGVIYLVNILRIAVLVVTQVRWPGFFSFTHDYSTTAIFYLVIFGLWVVWANIGEARSDKETK